MLLEKQELILTLLHSAESRLGLAIEMVETEQNCSRTLYQLRVVQATMHNCGQLLVQYELQQSLETACFDVSLEIRSAELKQLVDLYSYYQEFS